MDNDWKNIYNFSKKILWWWVHANVIQKYKRVKLNHLLSEIDLLSRLLNSLELDYQWIHAQLALIRN